MDVQKRLILGVFAHLTIKEQQIFPASSTSEVKAVQNIQLGAGFSAANNSTFDASLVSRGMTFEYDTIGNLVRDKDKGVKIKGTPYGKVREVNVLGGESITSFRYDGMGNRVEKKVLKSDTTVITRYVRDASGNVMGIYSNTTMIEQASMERRVSVYKRDELVCHVARWKSKALNRMENFV